MKRVRAISLFSGGLDSILATRLVMAQDIDVVAVQFVTPFFHYDILANVEQHRRDMLEKYGINVMVQDISEDYIKLLHNPAHGFGKNFNPCIDCKIMMFEKAREMLGELQASFLISGEVLGQRPMSQRRDTLNLIERDSRTRSLLLRPLSALLMPETEAERAGLVDRSQLLKMNGRSRSPQLALAARYGITDFPAPAGGCVLADPILSRRIKEMYRVDSGLSSSKISVADIRSLLLGRQFILPGGGWLIVGRDERENGMLHDLAQPEDAVLLMEDWPGPTAVLKRISERYADSAALEDDLRNVAAIVIRLGRKRPAGKKEAEVSCTLGEKKELFIAEPLLDELFYDWRLS